MMRDAKKGRRATAQHPFQFNSLVASATLAGHLVVTAQQLAWQSSATDIILESDLTIDNQILIAVGLLHTAPVAIREITHGFHWLHFEFFKIIDDNIRRHSLAQPAAISNADGPTYHS